MCCRRGYFSNSGRDAAETAVNTVSDGTNCKQIILQNIGSEIKRTEQCKLLGKLQIKDSAGGITLQLPRKKYVGF